MKKGLGILLIAVLAATLGLSGAVAAAPYSPGYNGGPIIGPGHHHGGTTIIIIKRHRHHFFPPIIFLHRHHHFFPPIIHHPIHPLLR